MSSIAIAGASDVSKYLIEELIASNPSNPPRIAVLTRSLSNRPWFTTNPHIELHVSDYTASSIQSILDKTNATALFSFLHSNDPAQYNTAHEAMLTACRMSEQCKRFIPSDYGGDIDRFPHLPRFYDSTHRVFRDTLANVQDVEWTVVNGGWFMDYFVQGSKVDPTNIPYGESSHGSQSDDIFDTTKARSYMKPLPGIWPLDLDTLTATVPGTGDEPIGWTSARDVARALVKLLDAPFGSWERHTYVVGDIQTWNEAIKAVKHFYRKRFTVTHKTTEDILQAVQDKELDDVQRAIAYMDEWNITGASAVPMDKVLGQREGFFSGVRFRDIREFMEDAFFGDLNTMV